MSLRQWEFTSAFRAEATSYLVQNGPSSHESAFNLQSYLGSIQFEFINALKYRGPVYESVGKNDGLGKSDAEPIPISQAEAYESAMQYITISDRNDSTELTIKHVIDTLIKSTAERCSLVRTIMNVVAKGDSYEDVADVALRNGSFKDMMQNGENANATWSVRLRRYTSENGIGNASTVEQFTTTSPQKNPQYQARYGKNVRSSLKDEKNAILCMSNLIELFTGKVNLKEPDCKVYVLEGMRDCFNGIGGKEKPKILLARVIANGPKVSVQKITRYLFRSIVSNQPITQRHQFTHQEHEFA